MSIVTISDIHIKSNTDEASKLLEKFFNHQIVKDSDKIIFLGDIFDLMIGPHEEYFLKYKVFFDGIKHFINNGKKIYYISGNHDFHLEKLFKKFLDLHKLNKALFEYSEKYITMKEDGKYLFLSHGDDIEIGNLNYKRYKTLISSRPLKLIANYVLPYNILNMIGQKASSTSRSYNQEKYSDNLESMIQVKKSFRMAADKISKKFKLDYILCGHSHVFDDYLTKEKTRYLNNGYLQNSKKFISINKNFSGFIEL